MYFVRLIIISVAILFTLCGCYESDLEFTLNSDRSGKVKIDMLFPENPFLSELDKGQEYDLMIQYLEAPGFETWEDVKFGFKKVKGAKRMFLKGTAYFRDITKLENDFLEDNTITPKKGGGLHILFSNPYIEEGFYQSDEKLSFNEIKDVLMELNESLNDIASIKIKNTWNLKGSIKTNGYIKNEENKYSFDFSGKEYVKVVKSIFKNKKYMKSSIEKGIFPIRDDVVMKKMYDNHFYLPLKIDIEHLDDFFNYESDVGLAKKNYIEMLNEIRASYDLPPTSLKVVPIITQLEKEIDSIKLKKSIPMKFKSYMFEDNKKIEKEWDKLDLSFEGIAPVEAKNIIEDSLEVKIDKVVFSSGEDYSNALGMTKTAFFERVENGKIKFEYSIEESNEANIKLIEENQFEEISGSINFYGGSKAKTLTLEPIITKDHENIAQFNTTFLRENPKNKQFFLNMNLPCYQIIGFQFLKLDGKELDVDHYGFSASSELNTDFSFAYDGVLPEKVIVVVNMYSDLKKNKFNFKLNNVSLNH